MSHLESLQKGSLVKYDNLLPTKLSKYVAEKFQGSADVIDTLNDTLEEVGLPRTIIELKTNPYSNITEAGNRLHRPISLTPEQIEAILYTVPNMEQVEIGQLEQPIKIRDVDVSLYLISQMSQKMQDSDKRIKCWSIYGVSPQGEVSSIGIWY